MLVVSRYDYPVKGWKYDGVEAFTVVVVMQACRLLLALVVLCCSRRFGRVEPL